MVAVHTSQYERKKSLAFLWSWENMKSNQSSTAREMHQVAAFQVNLMYFGCSVHTLYCTKESFDKIYPKPKSVFTYHSTSFVQ